MAVELALTPDGRWDISTEDLLAAARDAGFVAVGLSAARATPDAAAAYRQAGLRCHEILALMVSDDSSRTVASAEDLARTASEVGAEWVLTVFRSKLDANTAEIIRSSAAALARAGARMAVEFSPLGPVSTIADGLEVVAAAGPGRAGLMIDTWHFCRGGGTWEDLAHVPLEQIAYVQFADGLPPESDHPMSETMNRRALPGEGVFDLERFAATLRGRGWEGMVSVEVLSRELRELPVSEFTRRALAATAAFWS